MTRTKTRTARVYLWLTPTEKETWISKAAAVGLDLNEYIRRCVEKKAIAPVPIIPEVNRLTAMQLGKIGVNLNQQVRAMNTAIAKRCCEAQIASGQFIPDADEALSVVREVSQIVKALQSELLGVGTRK